MKITTWNVNGLRAALGKGILNWIENYLPDVLCLQEVRSKPEQIEQYFVEQYGARVLSEPPRTGLNWLVYILPPAIILAGAIMLFRSFRTWRTPGQETAADSPSKSAAASTDEYVQRLEEEVKKRG